MQLASLEFELGSSISLSVPISVTPPAHPVLIVVIIKQRTKATLIESYQNRNAKIKDM